MKRKLITSNSKFEQEAAYSRAVIQGDWIFVAGTTGYNYDTLEISDDIAEQTEQCFKNIEAALKEAKSSLVDVVRVQYIVPNPEDFPKCWGVLRAYFGEIRPSATMISADLLNSDIKIEIEVTAMRQK